MRFNSGFKGLRKKQEQRI